MLFRSSDVPVIAGLADLASEAAAGSLVSLGGRDIALPAQVRRLASRVARGATLSSLLHAHQVAEQEIAALIAGTSAVFDVRALRTDRPYRIVQAIEGQLKRFEYEIDNDRVLTVARNDDDEFVAAIDAIEKRTATTRITGAIDREAPSLFAAMARTGERVDLSMALADVLSSEIDFNTELQPDDRFVLTFEKWNREGRPSTYGAITAAEFHNAGRVVRAIRFTTPGGKPDYYDEHGRSLRRFFLRSPLKFEPRITSRYSSQRMHPILHTEHAHNGIDYGAPIGAPVVAISPGTVLSATYDNANGRMVRVRHSNGYVSFYLHLSAFAPGVSAGARVAQGQTIGRVGMTGLATGPHLHYGLQRNGAWVDPLSAQRNMPPGEPVPPEALKTFALARDGALAALGQTPSGTH